MSKKSSASQNKTEKDTINETYKIVRLGKGNNESYTWLTFRITLDSSVFYDLISLDYDLLELYMVMDTSWFIRGNNLLVEIRLHVQKDTLQHKVKPFMEKLETVIRSTPTGKKQNFMFKYSDIYSYNLKLRQRKEEILHWIEYSRYLLNKFSDARIAAFLDRVYSNLEDHRINMVIYGAIDEIADEFGIDFWDALGIINVHRVDNDFRFKIKREKEAQKPYVLRYI